MDKIINDLYKFNRCLLGEGYDQALSYIKEQIPLDTLFLPSGTVCGDWVIPEEWVIRDAWVKFNGEKILDYQSNPLCVTVGSLPVNKKVTLEELRGHLHVSDERPHAHSYDYKFYDRDWGFSMPKSKVMKHVVQKCEGGICIDELKDIDPTVGQVMVEGAITAPKYQEVLPEGEYEVFIDSEYKPGTMKIGIHTIPGKSKREILLFAHLDHPYQANDNLSGVACLMDMAKDLQGKFDHTIKIIFCPETIGSIAYATHADISKADFVIAVDSIGNKNSLIMQKAYDKYHRVNYCAHLAIAGQGVDYRKGEFRLVYGADEYYFNDPKIGIPGLFLSRLPFDEYHTSDDTPDKIDYDKIKEVQKVIMKTIEYYELDFIPERTFTGPLMRSRHGVQTGDRLLNRELDYLMYEMDGKKHLTEIITPLGLSFEFSYRTVETLLKEGLVKKYVKNRRPYTRKVKK